MRLQRFDVTVGDYKASTHIKRARHNKRTRKLYVQFSDGSWYRYHDVPADLVAEVFAREGSVGQRFNIRIKKAVPRFDYERLAGGK